MAKTEKKSIDKFNADIKEREAAFLRRMGGKLPHGYPPVGSTVTYSGKHQPYHDIPLVVHMYISDGAACVLPDGRYTTWLEPLELTIVEETSTQDHERRLGYQ